MDNRVWHFHWQHKGLCQNFRKCFKTSIFTFELYWIVHTCPAVFRDGQNVFSDWFHISGADPKALGSFLVGPAVGFSSTLLAPLLKRTLMSSRTQKQQCHVLIDDKCWEELHSSSSGLRQKMYFCPRQWSSIIIKPCLYTPTYHTFKRSINCELARLRYCAEQRQLYYRRS